MAENKMILSYNPDYPSAEDLKVKAKKRIPKFAFDYLEGGCNEDINLARNKSDLQSVQLMPNYLKKFTGHDTKVNLFGHQYDAPFGIAPIGLQGLIWPNSPEILAKAALKNNIPYILSTVSTSSIERIGELSEGRAWFQLYHPTKNELRDDIIKRAAAAQCPVLVVLVDVPSFGFRPRDIRNGLAMPPKMSIKNILQVMGKPLWNIETLRAGIPGFATLEPYMPKGLNMSKLGQFMNQTFTGRIDVDKIKPIREMWKGALVLKGIVNVNDLNVWLKVNGKIYQNSNTSNLIFKIPFLVRYISQFMTLLPGDVISTGTPPGVGLGVKPEPIFIKPGDIIELGIDGLGTSRQIAKAYHKSAVNFR